MGSCKKEPKAGFTASVAPQCTIDSVRLAWFFAQHPQLADHRNDVVGLYRHKNSCAWFTSSRLTEQAHVLYTRLLELDQEGLPVEIPYKQELEYVIGSGNPDPEADMLLSALYFYYTCQIYGGLDHDRAMSTGWFIPREKSVYPSHIDSVLKFTGKRIFFPQY